MNLKSQEQRQRDTERDRTMGRQTETEKDRKL